MSLLVIGVVVAVFVVLVGLALVLILMVAGRRGSVDDPDLISPVPGNGELDGRWEQYPADPEAWSEPLRTEPESHR